MGEEPFVIVICLRTLSLFACTFLSNIPDALARDSSSRYNPNVYNPKQA
jgi:hypothetical protein